MIGSGGAVDGVTSDGSAAGAADADWAVGLPGNAFESTVVRRLETRDFGLPVISGTPTLSERATSRE